MKLTIKEKVLFGMFGALMYSSKIIMELFPNIHLIGVFVITLTVVYRKKALYPIYIFVFLSGLFSGFSIGWIPYLYVWTILWAATMLLPNSIPKRIKPIIYMSLCSLHGFLFGVLFAPSQALLFGLDFNATIAWIIAGLPWDIVHGISNFFCGILIYPLVATLQQANKYKV